MFKIEKKVPLPDRGNARYPWADLKIGDSFFVAKLPPSKTAGFYSIAERHGFKIAVRRENGGARIWRTA